MLLLLLLAARLIQPNKGKKPVDLPDESQDHLFASTFKDGPAPDGCWCDMPPVGKRPLEPPSNASNFINAAQTMRILVGLILTLITTAKMAQDAMSRCYHSSRRSIDWHPVQGSS